MDGESPHVLVTSTLCECMSHLQRLEGAVVAGKVVTSTLCECMSHLQRLEGAVVAGKVVDSTLCECMSHLQRLEGAVVAAKVDAKIIRQASTAAIQRLPLSGSSKASEPGVCGQGAIGRPVSGSQAVASNPHIPHNSGTCTRLLLRQLL